MPGRTGLLIGTLGPANRISRLTSRAAHIHRRCCGRRHRGFRCPGWYTNYNRSRRSRQCLCRRLVTGQTGGIGKLIVFVKLGYLGNPNRSTPVAAETFRAPRQFMWNLRRTADRRVGLIGRNRWLVAGRTLIVGPPRMVGGEWTNRAMQTMTNLAIRCSANGMRDLRRCSSGRRGLGSCGRKCLRQARRVQSGERPFGAMARTVRAEGCIIFAPGIARIVALLAGGVELSTVFSQPGRRLVRSRFSAFRENDGRAGFTRSADHR